MRSRGPIVTLLAIVVLGLVLLAVNLSKSPTAGSSWAQAAPAGASQSAAAPAAAAGAPEFPATVKYTGYTDGNHAAVAVTVRDGQVSAYLCDGKAIEAHRRTPTQVG